MALYLTISEGEDHPVVATSDPRAIRAALDAISRLDECESCDEVTQRRRGAADGSGGTS